MSLPSQPTLPPTPIRWTRQLKEQWKDMLKTRSLPTSWSVSSLHGRTTQPVTRVHPPMAYTIARRLLLSHYLLVLDELQLQDVSSASLLADILSWFWRLGGVLVATSNRVPEDLYKNGVQRERLEGFVEALKGRCPVVELGSAESKDWREVRGAVEPHARTWFTQSQPSGFDIALTQAAGASDLKPSSRTLDVFGRILQIPWVCNGIAKFTFNELCNESLGPADYLTLAANFSTVAITDIPILNLSKKNQARRFISLIDALYEARCRLICLAESEPEGMFFPNATPSFPNEAEDGDVMMRESIAETGDVYRPNVSSYDTKGMEDAPESRTIALDTLSIFSGKKACSTIHLMLLIPAI
jgi:peroxisome-assembly ATPase